MLALNEEQLTQLPGLREKALANGVDDVELVSAQVVKRMEPNISSAVLGGLVVPRESIVDPFTTSIAYAEVAVRNAVDILFGFDVLKIDNAAAGIKSVIGTDDVCIPSRFVINASGLRSRKLVDTYAGLRCNCAQGSYWIRFNDGHPGIVTLAGIRSTGLTASISTAQYVLRQMNELCGLELQKNETACDSRSETAWPGWWRRPFDEPQRIVDCPDYGRIVCSCENISRGEIQDAIESCRGAATLDGLKRRTRVLTGRCQGFNCCVPVAEMISKHFRIPLAHVTKRGPGSEFIIAGDAVQRQLSVAAHSQHAAIKPRYHVVIVGAGPAGIGTAVGLAEAGISSVLLVERAAEVGGVPAKYEVKRGGVPTFVVWSRGRIMFGKQFVESLRCKLERTSTDVWLECQVMDVDKTTRSLTLVSPHTGKIEIPADAVVFACGAREKTRSERGWITGHRPARESYTMQVLQLLDGCHALPVERPAIIGSDLIAYSAAAKLRSAGSQEAIMFDQGSRPATGLLERFYFGRWSRPVWRTAVDGITVSDDLCVTGLQVGMEHQSCDGVVISGELVPNSELILAAGLSVSQPTRIPTRLGRNELSESGWFVAGAEIGGFHGAHWCYKDGRRAGRRVAIYLRKTAASERLNRA